MKDSRFLYLYMVVTFLLSLLMGIQGFDMCDEGYCLSAYQQLFEHPESTESQLLCYNGILIGAIWQYFFGQLGIWGFRLLSSLFTALLVFIVYKILYSIVNRWLILVGVLIVIFNQHNVIVFHRNLLTATICCASIFFLIKSIYNTKGTFSFLAGILIGINIFTRLPNISMLSLFVVYVVFCLLTKEWKQGCTKLLWGFLGVFVGAILNLLLIQSLGHLDLFMKNFSNGLSMASASDSTHNLSSLFGVYLADYKVLLHQIVNICSIPCIFLILIFRNISNKWLRYSLLLFIVVFYFYKIWQLNTSSYTLYAFSFIIFCLYIQKHREHNIYLITIATIMMVFLPLGSDFGIGNMGYHCVWLGFPLSLGLAWKLCVEERKYSVYFSLFLLSFIISITTNHIVLAMNGCYFDGGARLEKTSLSNHPLMTVRTNKFKCEILDELLAHLRYYVKEKDYLLCWQSIPMIHYLTHTYPYLNNPWPWTYDLNNFEKHLNQANNSSLPVVLCNKSVIGNWWQFESEWDSECAVDQWNFNSSKISLFHHFLDSNGYYIVWENDLFRILLPREDGDSSDI